MTQTGKGKEFKLDYLLHPGRVFETPMEVVKDLDLATQEKRAILASWASDACSVESAPDLRHPPAAPPVRFDDVMDALKRLDLLKELRSDPRLKRLVDSAYFRCKR